MDKKGPVRISPRLRAWIEETQRAQRQATGDEPDRIPDLLDRLLDAAKPNLHAEITPVAGVGAATPYPEAHREAHEWLEEILAEGGDRAGWIAGNLRTFVDAIRASKPNRPTRRAVVNE